ncbi:magnesium transporter NIPA-domain-containing protein [Collybia nuda]|uniref:Magnesium transporter NIPA-domain-containing protein n=1 Tax=Collybia nuda TaxID=64659 RepID=A0A9P5XYE9_9AGAR|nr:magnesium transporter NIPA-domain-containing protein [Collybia nuda]
MVEDKYIGLALAVSSSVAIGTSFIITKKGLNDAAARNSAYGAQSASDNLSYLKNPIWWAGITTLVIGEIANFAAYTFAPPILVTPLGALSVLIGAVLASFLLNEELGHLGRLGCTLCLIGSLIIVLHAPEDKPVETVDEILSYALRPGFLMYCLTVLVFTLVMIYGVAPKHGRSNPIVYISICSLVGSISVMAIKGFGVAVKLTFGGKNQFSHPSTYVFGIIVALCILVQMNYFNKALDTFSTNVVNPMYYVGFSTATAVASLILFQGFNTTDATNTVSLLTGFAVTFMGVHLLNLSRAPEPPLDHNTHSALEGGLMNPRLSLQGRMSLDGWPNGDTHIGPAPPARGHGRRSSLYRNQTSTLFNAFEEHDQNGDAPESVGLQRLREEEESDDDDLDADERTRLHKEIPVVRQSGSRSHSHSPIPNRPASTDVRISPRTVAP